MQYNQGFQGRGLAVRRTRRDLRIVIKRIPKFPSEGKYVVHHGNDAVVFGIDGLDIRIGSEAISQVDIDHVSAREDLESVCRTMFLGSDWRTHSMQAEMVSTPLVPMRVGMYSSMVGATPLSSDRCS